MNINILTDEELAKEIYRTSVEFYPDNVPSVSIKLFEELQSEQIQCWKGIAKFIRQCVQDSTPEGLTEKEIEEIIQEITNRENSAWYLTAEKLDRYSYWLQLKKKYATAIHAAQERKGKDNHVA